MTATAEAPLGAADLQGRLSAADKSAFLVKPRLLRRVIKQHAGAAGFGVQMPHGYSYALDSAALLKLVDAADLGLPPDTPLPSKVILLPRPDAEALAGATPEEILVRTWRRLFHARVHLALEQKANDGKLTDLEVRDRIRRLGEAEFDEVCTVLRQEKALLPPADDRTTYVEFAAAYLELRCFDPEHLPDFFPTLAHRPDIDGLLAEDVDAAALFRGTRLQGAPERPALETEHEDEAPPPFTPPSPGTVQELRGADGAAGRGNLVRAAILKTRAAAPTAANAELDLLVEKLRRALDLDEATAQAWRRALPLLLTGAASGFWASERRLLYDLQRVYVDSERGVFTVAPLRWAFSLGKEPLRRPLPAQQEALVLQYLRRARDRVHDVRLTEPQRHRLAGLLRSAEHHATARLRARFRPLIADAFDQVGLLPANLPERVARDKLIDELLDRLCERYLLTLGDVRDAVSRNQLKLPDLSGPGEFLTGDQLLRLDRLLADRLEGAYRPCEIYLRWLQRFSAAAFATRPGRLLTQYLFLPFGVAFFALKGIGLLIDEGIHGLKILGLLRDDKPAAVAEAFDSGYDFFGFGMEPQPAPHAVHHAHVNLATPWAVGLLGVFLLLVFRVPAFRRAVLQGLKAGGGVLHAVFLGAPLWLLRRSALRTLFSSRPVTFFHRRLLTPLVVAAVAAALTLLADLLGRQVFSWVTGSGLVSLPNADAVQMTGFVALGVFLVGVVLFNTRFGRDLEEGLVDWLGRIWQRISFNFIYGLFRAVMDFFRWCLEAVERLLYFVDEWLRFRTGESRLSLALKAVVAPVWYAVTYVIRIYVNLLIEPTVNPIKHFPVVTVGHKLMLPFLLVLYEFLKAKLNFLGPVLGNGFVVLTIFFLPGIFGFMVWELKENWKLYRANRSPTLRPVLIGSHGETMLRLLRPGFHSGTVPKLFGKLRRAERHRHQAAAHKQHEALHHVEESVRHFVKREFVHLLTLSKSWGGARLELGEVGLCTNRVRVELICRDLPGEGVEIVFDLRGGRLVAAVTRAGWVPHLSEAQRRAFLVALGGLYKRAGVDLTREQIDAALAPARPPYRINGEGLIVWPGEGAGRETVYPLDDGRLLRPHGVDGGPPAALPPLDADRLLFRNVPITWVSWVAAWDRDPAGEGLPLPFSESVRLLPQAVAAVY